MQMRVLNREARLILEGVDKHDNLIGRLMYVGAGEELVDLGTQLVTAGLAKARRSQQLAHHWISQNHA